MAPKKRVQHEASSSQPKKPFKRTSRTSRGAQSEEVHPQEEQGIPNNPHGILFVNEYQEANYNALVNREIVSTRYCDFACLRALGLDDDVRYLFDNIGSMKFFEFQPPTYVRLTLEFLSSFSHILLTPNNQEGNLRFRLFNEDHAMSLDDFCRLLGVKRGGFIKDRDATDFNANAFWNEITGLQGYNPSRAKASAIHHPTFRYVHRVLANTIRGRAESDGVCGISDLFLLWCMANAKRVNLGAFIASQLSKMARPENTKSVIVIGGIISIIAFNLKDETGNHYNTEDLEPMGGNTLLDMEVCKAFQLISVDANHQIWALHNNKNLCPLPCPRDITVKRRENWLLPSIPLSPDTTTTPTFVPPPPPPPSYEMGSSSGSHEVPPYMTEFFQGVRTTMDNHHNSIQREIRDMRHNMDTRIGGLDNMMRQFYSWHLDHGYDGPPLPPVYMPPSDHSPPHE